MLQERLGQAHMVLNQQEHAEADFIDMLESARASGDSLAEGRALFWLSFIRTRLYQIGDARSTAVAALQVAEEADNGRLLVRTQWNLGYVYKITGELDLADHHLR
jgi:hypothetical protein